MQTIRKVKDSEKKHVNAILHSIAKQIVDEAKRSNAVIVLGRLTGIRKRERGKRLSRIVANMPYYKVTQYITYKANWEGITVIQIDEAWTSKVCNKCNQVGERLKQGLFQCKNCNLIYNADLNGAINIAKRFSRYTHENGVQLTAPVTLHELEVGR